MKCEVFLSKNTDEWATPKFIYQQAMDKKMFDPCPLCSLVDGLQIEWGETNFVNPPYSQLKRWIEKSIEEHAKGRGVVLLIPARTDTRAFKLLFEYGSEITFITGRLRFNEANTAPFPSMIANLCGGGHSKNKMPSRQPRGRPLMKGDQMDYTDVNQKHRQIIRQIYVGADRVAN